MSRACIMIATNEQSANKNINSFYKSFAQMVSIVYSNKRLKCLKAVWGDKQKTQRDVMEPWATMHGELKTHWVFCGRIAHQKSKAHSNNKELKLNSHDLRFPFHRRLLLLLRSAFSFNPKLRIDWHKVGLNCCLSLTRYSWHLRRPTASCDSKVQATKASDATIVTNSSSR